MDLVAEMEAAAAANKAREEKLKRRIERLEQLLVKANHRAEANRQQQRERQEGGLGVGSGGGAPEGGSGDGDRYRWLMVWLLVGVSGVMWWRRRGR